MKKYREKYYCYQTIARNIQTKEQLLSECKILLPIYKHIFNKRLPQKKDSKILDCPCGFGNVTYFLKKTGYTNIDSIDKDERQIELAGKIGIRAKAEDGIKWLENRKEEYETIISLDFIEHLEKDEAIYYLELCYLSLKPGGTLILKTPCAEGPFFGTAAYNDITHEWVATSGVLFNLLKMSGFREIEILPDKPIPYKVVNIARLIAFYIVCKTGSFLGKVTGIGSPTIWTPNMWSIAKK